MTEKAKRKRSPQRPIWQVASLLLLCALIGGAGAYFYLNSTSVNDGADIAFLRGDGNSNNIYIRDIDDEEAEAEPLTDYEGSDKVYQFDVSPDGSWIVYDEQAGNQTKIWRHDLETGETSLLLDCSAEPLAVCWGAQLSPDGNTLLFAGADNINFYEAIGVLDLTDPDAVPELLFEGDILITYWVGNDQLLHWSWDDNAMFFYNIETGESESYETDSYWISVSPDGELVTRTVFNYDSSSSEPNFTYRVLNTKADAELSYQLPYGDPQQTIIAWSPDNTRMLIRAMAFGEGPDYNQIYLYDTETEETGLLFDREGYWIHEIVWNPDGTQFAMMIQPLGEYGEEGQIWIYDIESGDIIPTNEVGSGVQWLN